MNVPDPGDTARLCLPAWHRLTAASGADVLLLCLALFVFFLLICSICSAMDEALVSSSASKLRQMVEDGNRSAARVLKAGEKESRFCAAMQTGRLCAAIAATASLVTGCAPLLSGWLKAAGLQAGSGALAVALIALVAILILIPCGMRIPTALAGEHPEETAVRYIAPAKAILVLLTPFTALARGSEKAALRLAGADPNAPDEDVTEEEIREMVDAGEVTGAIEETEKDMIANILDFNDTTAEEVMTHRTDMIAIEDTQTPAELVQLAMENGLSRIPIYHEDLDNILGICYIKDYLKYIVSTLPEGLSLTAHMRPAYFIPESKKCSHLFTEMTERKIQMAIVVDEYGGTAGLITMEDLLESIVGNIQDEYDREDEMEIQQLGEHSYSVDGSTPVEDIAELTGETIPEGDYDTIAGFVMEQIGTVPGENEHPRVTFRSLTLTVQQVADRRITRLLVEQDPDWLPEEEAAEREKKNRDRDRERDKEKKPEKLAGKPV